MPAKCTTRLILIVLIATAAEPATADAPAPDILMIAVDDLRPMLGCYGWANIRTPNIDRLAERGVQFERAYCQYAKCGTSRLSLMTGLRPDAIGVFSNRDQDVVAFRRRRPDAISIARWLKQHGYHTQSFGKIDHDGWGNPDDWSAPSSPGRPREMWEVVDESDPSQPTIVAERLDCPVMQSPDVPDEHLFAGRMTRQVLDVMQNRSGTEPTFLAVGYRRPHLPFIAPRKYYDLYQPDVSWLAKNPEPADRSPVIAWFNSDGYVGSARRVGLTMPNPPNRQQAISWNGYEMRSYLGVPNHGPIEQPLQLKILQAYAACVSYVDAQIGRLFDALDRSPRAENTIVILWSDHGWHLGEQSAWSKMTNFEIATRVPLIVAAPGISPGRTRALAELVDLYPTICELADVPLPTHLEGETLTSMLHAPQAVSDQFALSQHARFQEEFMGRALRTDRFRFVQWTETDTGEVTHRELYDHDSDPAETRNVAGEPEYRDQVRHLEGQLQQAFQ